MWVSVCHKTAILDFAVADKFQVLTLGHFLSTSPIDRQSADREKENELVTDDSEREQGQEAKGRKEILRQVLLGQFHSFFKSFLQSSKLSQFLGLFGYCNIEWLAICQYKAPFCVQGRLVFE